MISIRKYLLCYLLLAVLSISSVAAIIAWVTTKHEVEELLNHNLQQLAQAIGQEQEAVASFSQAPIYKSTAVPPLKPFNGEADFFIQIWDQGTVVYRSHDLANFPAPTKNGFTEYTYQDATWYSYAAYMNNTVIQVSQPLDMQNEMVGEMLPGMVIPLAVQVPILVFLTWLIVGRGLRPLSAISAAIGKRNSRLLEPLSAAEMPIEIQPLVNELNELLDRLGSALHMQQQFTADAAHELRTPLTAVQLQLDILQRAKSDTDRDVALRKLNAGVQRSIHLVQQLLSMARQEPEHVPSATQPIDLAAAAAAAIEQFTVMASDKNIRLELRTEGAPLVLGESEGLRLLINNLLDNAIRYTPSGGEVEISVEQTPNGARLTVADSGIGIPEEERARIFDRFYRIPGSATFGTGLGLAIVKRIADSHHATIHVEARVGGSGTAFIVFFPHTTH